MLSETLPQDDRKYRFLINWVVALHVPSYSHPLTVLNLTAPTAARLVHRHQKGYRDSVSYPFSAQKTLSEIDRLFQYLTAESYLIQGQTQLYEKEQAIEVFVRTLKGYVQFKVPLVLTDAQFLSLDNVFDSLEQKPLWFSFSSRAV